MSDLFQILTQSLSVSRQPKELQRYARVWWVRTPAYDIDVVYPTSVDRARVQVDYPNAERIKSRFGE